MGIVQNQTIKNTIITYFGFALGAFNVLYMYVNYLSDAYHGLVTFVLSTAEVLLPFIALGMHNVIIKFYFTYKTKNNINSFLTLIVLLPLASVLVFGTIGFLTFDSISNFISQKNSIIEEYTWLIFVAALCFSYFEIFYAWSKVQLQSVFGNFLKEIFHRLGILILLLLSIFNVVSLDTFIYGVIIVYAIRTIIMAIYALSLKGLVFRFKKLNNLKSILKYASLIMIAGSIASTILKIDLFMIGQYITLENVAYYGVATYIAIVISVPVRSMNHITNPLTSQMLANNDKAALLILYRKSSINLFVICGFIFLLIMLNMNQFYELMPSQFGGGIMVVILISLAKLSDSLIGNNNAILFNSDYYRFVLFIGMFIAISAVVLNIFLIPIYGITGAALATCVSIFLYNSLKLFFVYLKFKMIPFTINTLKTLILILLLFGVFYFWEFPFHSIINIIFKSIVLATIYVLAVYLLDISEDITKMINHVKNRFLR